MPGHNSSSVTVANASAFWGDTPGACVRLLAALPSLDYLTFDYLAEVSLSIMAVQRAKDPSKGYAEDFIAAVAAAIPFWNDGHRCRFISNGGGLNPLACAQAVAAALKQGGLRRRLKIGVVGGDEVLDQLLAAPDDASYRHLDEGRPLSAVADRLVSANAYLGAMALADALASGCDIVISGRVADPSLTVAAAQHHHRWAWDDYDALAGATVAGHLIECGSQLCGGIATDWLRWSDPLDIGFPVAQIFADGSCALRKCPGSGGALNAMVAKEQLLYEIGDPTNYLSPDVRVSLAEVSLDEGPDDAVYVQGARGRPPPYTLKVSATYRAGFKAEASLIIFGERAYDKAGLCGAAILRRLALQGMTPQEHLIERLGGGDAVAGVRAPPPGLVECVLRVAVADERRHVVEAFTREVAGMVTAGPPGTTGYSGGRAPVRERFAYWPCLIAGDKVRCAITTFEVKPA